jgi:hypothetical protein
MAQETLHEHGIVEWHILMHDAFGQAGAREPRRGHRRGGEKDADFRPLGGDGLDDRERGIGLAHACGMEPGEEALRARRGRKPVALGAPVALLFAAARAPGEDERGERGGNACQRPVGLEHQSRLGSVVRGQGITGSS